MCFKNEAIFLLTKIACFGKLKTPSCGKNTGVEYRMIQKVTEPILALRMNFMRKCLEMYSRVTKKIYLIIVPRSVLVSGIPKKLQKLREIRHISIDIAKTNMHWKVEFKFYIKKSLRLVYCNKSSKFFILTVTTFDPMDQS